MGTRKSRAFRAGLKLGLQPPATLAEWVLALDAAYPGEPEAEMSLPAEAWAELVTLARVERAAAGPVDVTDFKSPEGVRELAPREGGPLVLEGLRAPPSPPKVRRFRVTDPDPVPEAAP